MSFMKNKLSFIENLPPSYFSMVMATGALSLGLHALGYPVLPQALFYLNAFAYLVLWVLYIARLIMHPRRVGQDLISHQLGPGYFTSVASSCVLGTQFILIADNRSIAAVLLAIGTALWLGLTYTIFTGFTIKETKPQLANGISGAWLLAVVATQAISVLTAMLAAHVPQPYRIEMNFVALSMWLWGGMLYIWMISLIFYRYTFFRFQPSDLSPPYWINMGAMAISVLAGTKLIANAPHAPFLDSLLPFIKGFTVFYWATGTWWIPMLVILVLWRHLYKRYPFQYDPLYWGAVFPLAMYTLCSQSMATTMHLDFLLPLPRYFVYLAIAAWTLTFIGLLRHILRPISAQHMPGQPRP